MKKSTPTKQGSYALVPVTNGSNFVQAEVNIEKLPIFTTSKTKKFDIANQVITYSKECINDGVAVSLTWKVLASPEYGLPNYFDRDVYRCIQKIIFERGVLDNGYITFSTGEIINLLGHRKSGYISSKIQESLKRLTLTGFVSEGAFYSKDSKTRISDAFHLFESFTAKNKKFSNGKVADTNYLKLGEILLDSIISGYIKPVDFDYYIGLNSTNAKALYSRLSIDFYGLPEDVPCLRKRYSELCKETLITYQKYPSLAKNYLKKAFDELISTNFLAGIEFESIPNVAHDFYILFYPGDRVNNQSEYEKFKKPQIEEFEPSQPLRIVKNKKDKAVKPSQSPVINTVVESVKDQLTDEDKFIINSLIEIGVTEAQAKECAKNHKERSLYWIKAKDHQLKATKIVNVPAYIYSSIIKGWKSAPYDKFLQMESRKKQHQEIVIKKKEEDKKIIEAGNQEWQQWEPVVTFIENLDINIKQDLYNFVRQSNKANPFVNKININEKLTALRLTQFKDSFFKGIKELDIDILDFQHLFEANQ